MAEQKKIKKRAKRQLEDLKFVLKKAGKRKGATPDNIEAARRLGEELEAALDGDNFEAVEELSERLDKHIEENLADCRPNAAWETAKALIIAIMIALSIRWMFIEPFRIPSGSMIPTLLVGDQLMVNKLSFGPDLYVPVINPDTSPEGIQKIMREGALRARFSAFGQDFGVVVKKLWVRRDPRRGEIVVFRFPPNPKEDYIKRVVGLPGDVIEMRDNKLYVNGELQEETRIEDYNGPVGKGACRDFGLYHEDLDSDPENRVHDVIHCETYPGAHADFGPITVPPGHFFGMGDNRDQSSDSRSWGFVPMNHLKGTAMFIHLPLDPDNYYLPRWGRFFKPIK